MVVPPGFTVELAAAEPLVRQPVAIDFDDRKRLWVLQYLQYPNPAGLQRVKVDRWSRTEYDRLPKPPPYGPRGQDRLTILLDSDGDGRADTSKDFVTGLNLASGFAFGDGGVYVLNVPYLLYYPDRDQDDVPDSPPEALVTGFGMQDAHSVANSLTWGPDGWLYGSQGSTVTSKIRGVEFEQGVWRYHPRRAVFELFCEGGGNSWGVDFNSEGELLYSTNFGGHVMLHGEQGAYYWKSFAKHGGLHNPYAFGYFDHVPHENFQGGHVSVGGFFYTGDTFPAEYRGKYIAGDLLGHGVKWHDVEPRGSSFRSNHGGELVSSIDTWFAPTDVTQGPDGAVYVADWHDQRMAHPDPDAEWDRSNGRVFRIQAAGAQHQHVDHTRGKTSHRQPTQTLLERLDSTNGWVARRAHRMLAERRDPSAWPTLENRVTKGGSPQVRLQALWSLYSSGGFTDETAARWLEHRDEAVRSWIVRFLGDRFPAKQSERERTPESKLLLSTELRAALQQLAREDPSVHVRSQLAASAQRFDASLALTMVRHLLLRNLDDDDPHLGLLVWWAIERHAVASLATVERLFLEPGLFESRMAVDVVLPRLVKRWSAEGTPAALDACARLLDSGSEGPHLGALLAALEEGLTGGRRRVQPVGSGGLFRRVGEANSLLQTEAASDSTLAVSQSLHTQLADLGDRPAVALTVLRIRALLGDPLARQEALKLAASPNLTDDQRLSIVQLLTRVGADSSQQTMISLLEKDKAEPVRSAALGYLTRFASPTTTQRLLALYPKLPSNLRSQIRAALLSRKESTRQLLDAVANGTFKAEEVSVDELRAVALHNDKELEEAVRRRWGRITAGTPEEKLAQMRRHNNDLRAAAGDTRKGRTLFEKQCAACHKFFDAGRDVGPDLTHANRQDREYLLASIVDPSRVVRTEHLASVVVTHDGQVVTGLIRKQTPASITLVDVRGELVTMPQATIREIRPSETSLMPENLLRDLRPQELRDLFAYLQLKKAPD
jgi:putative membrane-bound dehydrogenase-like protein